MGLFELSNSESNIREDDEKHIALKFEKKSSCSSASNKTFPSALRARVRVAPSPLDVAAGKRMAGEGESELRIAQQENEWANMLGGGCCLEDFIFRQRGPLHRVSAMPK